MFQEEIKQREAQLNQCEADVDEGELSKQTAMHALGNKQGELLAQQRARQKAQEEHRRVMNALEKEREELHKSVRERYWQMRSSPSTGDSQSA